MVASRQRSSWPLLQPWPPSLRLPFGGECFTDKIWAQTACRHWDVFRLFLCTELGERGACTRARADTSSPTCPHLSTSVLPPTVSPDPSSGNASAQCESSSSRFAPLSRGGSPILLAHEGGLWSKAVFLNALDSSPSAVVVLAICLGVGFTAFQLGPDCHPFQLLARGRASRNPSYSSRSHGELTPSCASSCFL